MNSCLTHVQPWLRRFRPNSRLYHQRTWAVKTLQPFTWRRAPPLLFASDVESWRLHGTPGNASVRYGLISEHSIRKCRDPSDHRLEIFVHQTGNSFAHNLWKTCALHLLQSVERQVAHPISLLFMIRNGWNFVSRHIFSRCFDIQNFSSLSLVLS